MWGDALTPLAGRLYSQRLLLLVATTLLILCACSLSLASTTPNNFMLGATSSRYGSLKLSWPGSSEQVLLNFTNDWRTAAQAEDPLYRPGGADYGAMNSLSDIAGWARNQSKEKWWPDSFSNDHLQWLQGDGDAAAFYSGLVRGHHIKVRTDVAGKAVMLDTENALGSGQVPVVCAAVPDSAQIRCNILAAPALYDVVDGQVLKQQGSHMLNTTAAPVWGAATSGLHMGVDLLHPKAASIRQQLQGSYQLQNTTEHSVLNFGTKRRRNMPTRKGQQAAAFFYWPGMTKLQQCKAHVLLPGLYAGPSQFTATGCYAWGGVRFLANSAFDRVGGMWSNWTLSKEIGHVRRRTCNDTSLDFNTTCIVTNSAGTGYVTDALHTRHDMYLTCTNSKVDQPRTWVCRTNSDASIWDWQNKHLVELGVRYSLAPQDVKLGQGFSIEDLPTGAQDSVITNCWAAGTSTWVAQPGTSVTIGIDGAAYRYALSTQLGFDMAWAGLLRPDYELATAQPDSALCLVFPKEDPEGLILTGDQEGWRYADNAFRAANDMMLGSLTNSSVKALVGIADSDSKAFSSALVAVAAGGALVAGLSAPTGPERWHEKHWRFQCLYVPFLVAVGLLEFALATVPVGMTVLALFETSKTCRAATRWQMLGFAELSRHRSLMFGKVRVEVCTSVSYFVPKVAVLITSGALGGLLVLAHWVTLYFNLRDKNKKKVPVDSMRDPILKDGAV